MGTKNIFRLRKLLARNFYQISIDALHRRRARGACIHFELSGVA
jgi:hypothetical protein